MRKQRSASAIGFTSHDIYRLEKGLKAAVDKRYYQRLQSVLAVAEGMAATQVCKLTGSSLKSIYNYVNAYLSIHQLTSLCEAPRCGRPVTAPAISDKRIRNALQRNPLQLGYRTTSWSVAVLADYLNRKYSCSIGVDTLRRRMKAMGLRFKRPRYVYVEKDPNRTQKKGRSSGS